MIRLLVTSPDLMDASSFYRAVGPAAEMERLGLARVTHVQKATWKDIIQCDAVLIHRPSEETHLEFLKYAKAMRKTVWIDYDDDLTDPPECNPSHRVRKARIPRIQEALELADLVTVSTSPLLNKFKWFSNNIHVVRNALDFNLLGEPTPTRTPGEVRRIVWRGGTTHTEDLRVMDGVFERVPDAQWIFFANKPEHTPPGSIFIPPTDIITYHRALQAVKPDLLVYPLVDCYFNHCKSNIAYLEAAWAGARVVGPRFPEWEYQVGCWNYDPDDIAEAIEEALSADVTAGSTPLHLRQHYNLEDAAHRRHDLLKEVMS